MVFIMYLKINNYFTNKIGIKFLMPILFVKFFIYFLHGKPLFTSNVVSAPIIDKNAANSYLSSSSSPVLQKSGKSLAASVKSLAH